jgi:hypothetical protein
MARGRSPSRLFPVGVSWAASHRPSASLDSVDAMTDPFKSVDKSMLGNSQNGRGR